MAPKLQNLTGLIVGTLKITAPTDKKDSSKCRIWEAECCTCGMHEYGTRSQLERYAGHAECPGHPFKGKEKELKGFRLVPEIRDTPEQAAASAAWESARNGKAPEETKAEMPEPPKEKKPTNTNGSDILRKRLGLDGYKIETVALATPVNVQGLQVYKAVFAKALVGEDRVFLHVETVSDDGKRGLISSVKKITPDDWSTLCAAFAELKLSWREKEPKKKAA